MPPSLAAGKAMTREQIIAYALQEDDAFDAEALSKQQPKTQVAVHPSLIEALTERELDILHSVAVGRSNREIAAEHFLALGTVKWYLNSINTKLGVTSRTQAVARARELGLFAS